MRTRPQIAKIVAVTLACLMAFGAWRHHERNRKRELHMPMKTYAAGRFQLDIPEPSTLAGWGRQDIPIGSITVFPEISKRKFQKMIVDDRVASLKNVTRKFGKLLSETSTDMVDVGEGTLLEKYVHDQVPNSSHVLFWGEDGFKGEGCKRETYYWIETPGNFSQEGVGYRFEGGIWVDAGKQQTALREISDYLSRIRPRRDDEVPQEPGYCFQHAFLAGDVPSPSDECFEAIAAEWRLAHHPDVVISLYTQGAPTVKPEGLIARHRGAMPEVLARFIRGVRSRKRTLGEYAGEEIVVRTKEKNGTSGCNAMWEFEGGDERDLTRPYIMVQMFSGSGDKEPVECSLSEAEFLAMWDAVLESFRWRGPKPGTGSPVSEMPPAAAPRPRSALGTRIRSGERCPEAGTWTCAHGENLGGAKRVFREGEELPAAVLDVRRGWFGTLMGRPAETVVDTVWTLAGYPEGTPLCDQSAMGSPAAPS